MSKEKFQKWCEKKIGISDMKGLYFHDREIWWCNFGQNIGFEANGKGELFLRPGIIVKKINNNTFYILPLTSVDKEGKYGYFEVSGFEERKKSFANLMQIRVFDNKRLVEKCGKIPEDEFVKIIKKVQEFFSYTI